MCWMCDHPDRTEADYLRQVVQPKIELYGWTVQAIGGEGPEPPFAYTVGLTALGFAELVVTGLPATASARLLNHWARYVVEKDVLLPGETAAAGETRVEVVVVGSPHDHLLLASSMYGPSLRALQLVWFDRRGHSPWCPAFQGTQPLLGKRAETPP